MTIGVDVSRAFRKEKTGIEWYVFHLMKALADIDTEHEYIFYTDRMPPGDMDAVISSRLRILHWPFKHFWTQGRLSLEMLVHPPDVLLIPASALPLIHPQKTITVVHDVGFFCHTTYRSWQDVAYLKWSTLYALKQAWRIVAVSEWTKQEIIRNYRTPSENIHVVHIGLDSTYAALQDKSAIRATIEKYGIQQPYFLTIGRIDERKNIKSLVQGFVLFSRSNSSHCLVVAGPKGYGAQKSIAAIEEAHKMGVRIMYIPWLEEYEKKALLSGCAAFVFPSLYEGFGIPVIEAQACHVPVITSQTTSLPEIAGAGALYIDPQSALSIANAMQKIASDVSYAAHLTEIGYENTKRFTWKSCARGIDSLSREKTVC
ncbi:MAG: glycosyltransferase family 1 protein [Patescibacteria group bacterium]